MRKKAFTLIELLIVVAIIAILAAIAVPNFLEAQTRSKVSRVRADLRTLDTALKTYYTDFNRYPYDFQYSATATKALPEHARLTDWGVRHLFMLSTPIAYIASTNIDDPFMPENGNYQTSEFGGAPSGELPYFNLGYGEGVPGRTWGDQVSGSNPKTPVAGFVLVSYGPDKIYMGGEWISAGIEHPTGGYAGTNVCIDRIYDPTNGTVSRGDLVRLDAPGFDAQF